MNVDAFETYCKSAAELYVEQYSWFHMPPSVHIILLHGHQIIRNAILPIGMYSEEAQESSNKIIKKFRNDYSRKTSR